MKDQLITLPLVSFIKSHLGYGHWECRPIPKEIGMIIVALTKNERLAYVQWLDEQNDPLEEPILWDYAHWVASAERHKRAKDYSHKQRVKRFLLEANTLIVGKAYQEFSGVDGEAALVTARMLLEKEKYRQIKVFCREKLLTKEEEL